MTGHLKKLTFLDDRIISEYEKTFAEAFVKGGSQAEQEAREAYQNKKQEESKNYHMFAKKHAAEGRKKRKMIYEKMVKEL